ncbi:MAG: Nuclear envelope morphology protein 1 [Caeruleum heppii]|nr:MAG: Nuclear envelope morphology protein 1 [Caeruleum heppii]
MNSLNLLSARVIGTTPPPSPTKSRDGPTSESTKKTSRPSDTFRRSSWGTSNSKRPEAVDQAVEGTADEPDEKSPLLESNADPTLEDTNLKGWKMIPKRLADALIESIRWVLSTLAAPGVYLIACLYDERGDLKLRRLFRRRRGRRSTAQAMGMSGSVLDDGNEKRPSSSRRKTNHRRTDSGQGLYPPTFSHESELVHGRPSSSDRPSYEENHSSSSHHPRTQSFASSTSSEDQNTNTTRRSIRIKLYNEDSQRRRRTRNKSTDSIRSETTDDASTTSEVTPATLKSPTSPSSSSLRMTKYPRAPAPPRPLIPRRTPSYDLPGKISSKAAGLWPQKTLILDLDETLIHSLAKGGRMSTGHMVEVKLNAPVGYSGGVARPPQHPILYYVHKRPHCDEFLRKVSRWYQLVIFTASVQEYADPVIDWLETDRKYFSGRYYRQHCTFRGGSYIKDLSCVEPDLSRVMIVDNSPASYVFHEDNAIPIEGWINDPTDNDLLHLIPLLEALGYVTDVRALLALRTGEAKS